MNALSHALVGYAIAGWPGAAAAVVPDVPVLLCDMWQAWRGVDVVAARRSGLQPRGPVAVGLWRAHRIVHSAAGLAAVVAGPVGMAFASHVITDWLTHPRARVMPGIVVRGDARVEFYVVLACLVAMRCWR